MNKVRLNHTINGIVLFLFFLLLFSCKSTNKTTETNVIYEVLTEQNNGGANFRFYEILTEEKEIKMLLNDPNLKNKIKPTDIKTCNFVILNMGEQSANNKIIKVKKVEETPDRILIYLEDGKESSDKINNSEIATPYTIIKIYSKKEILIQ